MTKVAIYCRVDHGSIAYGQFAIERQKKQLERYAKNTGMRIAGCYTDCGYRGSDLDRPGLVKLQKAWKAGRFDAVVVVKKDRLYSGILQNAPEWQFKVISLTERENIQKKKNVNLYSR